MMMEIENHSHISQELSNPLQKYTELLRVFLAVSVRLKHFFRASSKTFVRYSSAMVA